MLQIQSNWQLLVKGCLLPAPFVSLKKSALALGLPSRETTHGSFPFGVHGVSPTVSHTSHGMLSWH